MRERWKEWGKERERKREGGRREGGGEKGNVCVAHLLLMSCESFANCLQVATKSGILSSSWLTCSSTATNCVCKCGMVVEWWRRRGAGELREEEESIPPPPPTPSFPFSFFSQPIPETRIRKFTGLTHLPKNLSGTVNPFLPVPLSFSLIPSPTIFFLSPSLSLSFPPSLSLPPFPPFLLYDPGNKVKTIDSTYSPP